MSLPEIGQRFGRLTVVLSGARVQCCCACGTSRSVNPDELATGSVQECRRCERRSESVAALRAARRKRARRYTVEQLRADVLGPFRHERALGPR